MDRGLYSRVWRWHFYAGLFVIPILISLSITGIIYLFKPQMDLAMYPHLLTVKSQEGSSSVSADLLLQEVLKNNSGSRVVRYAPAPSLDRSAEFVLKTQASESVSAFIHPKTGEYLGARSDSGYIQVIAKKIHGELLIGTLGDRLVELAACWALILVLTGLYLWWPRGGSNLWGVWLPRLRSGGRVFWKDIHSVIGIYSSIFIILFILSGLPWAGFWGDQFSKIWNTYPDGTFSNVPKSSVLNQGSTQVVPWAAESAPLPTSHHHRDEAAPTSAASPSPQVSLQKIVELAELEGAPAGYTISLPEGSDGVFTVAAFTGQPKKEMTLHIDQYSGKKLFDVRFADYGFVPRLVTYGIALHQGQLFGWPNQLVCLLICIAILMLCFSGIIIWWKRRPAGTLGAPAKIPGQIGYAPKAIGLLLAIAFPLVGVSLVVILVIDFLFISKLENR